MFLKQGTAAVIWLGKYVDDGTGGGTAGVTPRTNLTITNTDIKLMKEGSTSPVSKNSGGATHAANGRYYCTLDATDVNTLGRLEVTSDVSGALGIGPLRFVVLSAAVYDWLLGTVAPSTHTAAAVAALVTADHGAGSYERNTEPLDVTATATAAATGAAAAISAYDAATGADVAAAVSAIRGADADTLKTLSDQIDGLDVAGGTGPSTVTLTVVSDDAEPVPVPGAEVALKQAGILRARGTTDADGEVVLATEDGTFDLVIAVAGFNGLVAELDVAGDTAEEFELERITPEAIEAGFTTGLLTAYDAAVAAAAGVKFTVRILTNATAGTAFSSAARTITSGADGVTQFTRLPHGSTVEIIRENGSPYEVTVPDTGGSFNLPAVIGKP